MIYSTKCFITGLMLCFCHFVLSGQQSKIDSLLFLLKKDKEDTNKVNHLNKLALEYKNAGSYDTALYYANINLQLANTIFHETKNPLVKQTSQKGIAVAYSDIIRSVHYNKGNYPQAIEAALKALEIYEDLGNKKGIASMLGNIGLVYYRQSDYPKALNYYLKAMKMAEELGDKNKIATLLGNIGIVYVGQGDYVKALDYYFKALKIAEEQGDKNGTGRHLGSIGNVYFEQKDYPKALDYFLKALNLAEEQKDKNRMIIWLGNIGNVYANQQKDYLKALDYFLKALKMAEELGDKNNIAIQLANIGSLYTKTGKFKEAEAYIKKAMAIDDSIGEKNDLRKLEEFLSHLYDTTGRHKLALIHYKRAMVLKDTLFNQDKNKEITGKAMTYEFDKKIQAAKAEQDKKDVIVEGEKRRQKIVIYSISGGLFLVLLLAIFIFRGYKQKQKANVIIIQQKKEVEKAKHIIEEKNKDITDSINYAKRIQQAKLPDKKEIYASLPNSFVLFKPKDIVSGDFYYFHKKDKSIFIASADCTGHGVPGALMSMIGSEKLDDALAHSADTSEILKHLNKGIKVSLRQTDSNESTRDGMDIALCSVDTVSRMVKYAGANRPIWIIRHGQTAVEEIKATKKAIGGFTEDSQHFDTHEIRFQEGDTFYISTDGYADTFGGKEEKKLTTKKFKEILLSIQDKTMNEQEKHLDSFIENWKGRTEQIDDILVIGVRL